MQSGLIAVLPGHLMFALCRPTLLWGLRNSGALPHLEYAVRGVHIELLKWR